MQEPLARGEVLVAWDHVARLVNAPADKPDDWLMVPAPRGPKGRGYMLIIAGMALPKNGKDRDLAEKAIRALTEPASQIETLRSNAFFPVVQTELPSDLTGAIALEAAAVRRQQRSAGALLALPRWASEPRKAKCRRSSKTASSRSAWKPAPSSRSSIPRRHS